MYSKSRKKKGRDPKHCACANCRHLVKVTYEEMAPGGITGEWHCRKALKEDGFTRGKTIQQPWTFTCTEFRDRPEKTKHLDLIPDAEATLI